MNNWEPKFPLVRPTTDDTRLWVEWKSTDIRAYLDCDCGERSILDGYTFSFVECWSCNQVWEMDWFVRVAKSTDQFGTLKGESLFAEEESE